MNFRIGEFSATNHRDGGETRTELDTHADACVVGRNALIVQDFNRPVDVSGYDPGLGTKRNLRTVSGALAYDDPTNGNTVILVIHQAIHIPTMHHNLLTPMQLRMNDIRVRDIPRFLIDTRGSEEEEYHAITIPGNEETATYTIPLSLHGIISFFPTRKPTAHEFDTCPRYELTYEAPIWDPTSTEFLDQERNAQHPHRPSRARATGDQITRVPRGSLSAVHACSPISAALSDGVFAVRLTTLLAATSLKPTGGIQPSELAQRWGIGIEAARRTLNVTTQRGVRTVAHPSLSRRFRTNDRQLRYRRLATDIYADTLVSKHKSKRGNLYAQVFATKFGWCRVFPMQRKSDAHHALSLLFARDGVPPRLIVDGSKEQMQGAFRRKARQADCQLRAVEPHSPWSNAAEAAIRELKRGAGRKMVRTSAPKRLWDHCLELEALIRSNTALDVYELRGQVPETVVSGETSDISPFVELAWYQWIMFRDTGVSFPHDREVIGRYLGPSTDIGPAMTAQILKSNGWIVHRSTYRGLTQDEMKCPDHTQRRKEFDDEIQKKLGTGYDPDRGIPDEPDQTALEGTPGYDLAEEERLSRVNTADEESSADIGDNYIGAEVTLPLGEHYMTGRVTGRKANADGSAYGRANANPILDTRVYEVEFEDGAVAEFSANTIAENMWAQCDSEGRQFLLMDEIIGHRKNKEAVDAKDGFLEKRGRKYRRKTTKHAKSHRRYYVPWSWESHKYVNQAKD